jgi:hypothetical protein|tara:strand:+ start:81 stop:263 length:183 start_codon:yes stop_codon:yes gene_type:complete
LFSASLAGCIGEEEEKSDEVDFFGVIYWNQDGIGMIWEEDTGYTVLPLYSAISHNTFSHI